MAEWDSAHDSECKQILSRVLKDDLHIYTTFDQILFINKTTGAVTYEQPPECLSKEDVYANYEVHLPDLFSKPHALAVEIDGDWHFNTKKGIKQTNKRNEDYDFAKIKLLWMTPKEILDCKDDDAVAGLILGLLEKPHTYFVP